MADGVEDGPSCSVCLNPFDSEGRKPWDLGCGHSYCEACLRAHPRSFRTCPECRSRASMPHVNISLLRMLGPPRSAAAGSPPSVTPPRREGPPSTRQRSQRQQQPHQQQQQQQQLQQAIPDLIFGAGGGAAAAPRHGGNPIAAAIALASTIHQAVSQRRAGPGHRNPEVAAWKASVWTWLGPLLALLYIISPLDAIPDFLPLIGWVDDILVALYLATAMYSRLSRAQAAA